MRGGILPAAAFIVFLAAAAPTLSLTIHVPDDQPTIQSGLHAAASGDTVLVACGTYYEYGIDLKSGVALRGETGRDDCVTIDGQVTGQWASQDIGILSNDAEPMYVAVANSNGTTGVVYHEDPDAVQTDAWTQMQTSTALLEAPEAAPDEVRRCLATLPRLFESNKLILFLIILKHKTVVIMI